MSKKTLKRLLAGAMTAGMMALFVLPLAVNNVMAQDSDYTDLGLDQIGGYISDSGGTATLPQIIGGVISTIMGILGVIVVLIILWGGFIWMTAGGEPDKVDKAKKMIYSGIIGLVIIFASYAIAQFVIGSLQNVTS
jgi:hypothetical protein